jgi:hypothetical protein
MMGKMEGDKRKREEMTAQKKKRRRGSHKKKKTIEPTEIKQSEDFFFLSFIFFPGGLSNRQTINEKKTHSLSQHLIIF